MRKLLPLVALLAAVSARAGEPVRAPVPKAPPVPSLAGKYTLMSSTTLERLPAAGPGGGPGGFGGPVVRRAALQGETVITHNEITIEPRNPTALPTVMEYALDTTKTPFAIDAELVSVKGKKTKMLGVVEQSGSRLTIALAKEGAERPKSIEEAEGVTVYYFQKSPRTEYRIVALKVGKEEDAEKELNQLAKDGFEVVSTSSIGVSGATAPTTTHIVLKRTVK